ncbi:MAG: riboflavin biosynthesis protein RibF [Planctomycetota bacterium]
MLVLEGIESLERIETGEPSATLVGVFDGVHLGHQRLLHELQELASRHRALATVVTFQNHPDEFLRGTPVDWIVSLQHRLRLLRRAGVDRVLSLRFDERIREMTAERFCREILCSGLQTKALLLGYDSAIGKNREGTPARLRELGQSLDFEVEEGSRFTVDGEPVSSTAIRRAILAGDLVSAHRMLGRWPSALGTVQRGDGRGRGLGFPTANLLLDRFVLPPAGVYAIEALLGGEEHFGVAHLGPRPSFDRASTPPAQTPEPTRLEVHLFEQSDRDLYDERLEVFFRAWVRAPATFDDLQSLKVQIQRDAESARRLLSS